MRLHLQKYLHLRLSVQSLLCFVSGLLIVIGSSATWAKSAGFYYRVEGTETVAGDISLILGSLVLLLSLLSTVTAFQTSVQRYILGILYTVVGCTVIVLVARFLSDPYVLTLTGNVSQFRNIEVQPGARLAIAGGATLIVGGTAGIFFDRYASRVLAAIGATGSRGLSSLRADLASNVEFIKGEVFAPASPSSIAARKRSSRPVLDLDESQLKVLTVTGAFGAALSFLGALLPWARWGPYSAPGTDGDGLITLVLAIAIGMALLWAFLGYQRALVYIASVAASVLILGIGIYDMSNVARLTDSSTGVTIGAGLYLTVIGGLVGAGASALAALATVRTGQG